MNSKEITHLPKNVRQRLNDVAWDVTETAYFVMTDPKRALERVALPGLILIGNTVLDQSPLAHPPTQSGDQICVVFDVKNGAIVNLLEVGNNIIASWYDRPPIGTCFTDAVDTVWFRWFTSRPYASLHRGNETDWVDLGAVKLSEKQKTFVTSYAQKVILNEPIYGYAFEMAQFMVDEYHVAITPEEYLRNIGWRGDVKIPIATVPPPATRANTPTREPTRLPEPTNVPASPTPNGRTLQPTPTPAPIVKLTPKEVDGYLAAVGLTAVASLAAGIVAVFAQESSPQTPWKKKKNGKK